MCEETILAKHDETLKAYARTVARKCFFRVPWEDLYQVGRLKAVLSFRKLGDHEFIPQAAYGAMIDAIRTESHRGHMLPVQVGLLNHGSILFGMTHTLFTRDFRPAVHASIDVARLQGSLSPQEQEIIRRRFVAGEPESCRVIGKSLGLSRGQVEHIEGKALAKMAVAAGLRVPGQTRSPKPGRCNERCFESRLGRPVRWRRLWD